jgi:hypothetical protein
MTENELRDLLNERAHLRRQRDDLQERGTQLITETRALRKEHPCLACVLLARLGQIRPKKDPAQTELGDALNVFLSCNAMPLGDAKVEHTCDG